ncbi:MAG TPA: hypothetical protein VJN64_15135 [Terriglobales bacterium]|nr:hypothetical protein [Terriglobales bacterium]
MTAAAQFDYTVHLTPKAVWIADQMIHGARFEDALAFADREFTDDGMEARSGEVA